MTPTLLCLHGWGGSKASFDPLRDALAGTPLEILTPDLPGFGDEPDPPQPWTVDDYAAWVRDWTMSHKKSSGPLLLLGHSHGGRTSIVLAAKSMLPIDHLFLCAPAINRKHRYVFRRTVGAALARMGRAIFSLPGLSRLAPLGRKALYKLFRVHDYERASPLMQQTLVLVTRDDIESLLPMITQPLDLFWGTNDDLTPIADARYVQEHVPQCTLHIFQDARHGIHKTHATDIAGVIRQRLTSL